MCYDIALFNDTSANGWGHYYFGGPATVRAGGHWPSKKPRTPDAPGRNPKWARVCLGRNPP
jgi:hypothetical protein